MVFSKITVQLLLFAACNASVIKLRDAQAPAAPKPPSFLGQLRDILATIDEKNPVGTLKASIPQAKVAKITQLQPKLRAEAKRINVQYGPYLMAGKNEPKPKGLMGSLDPNGQGFADLISDGLCKNCTILAGRTKVTLEDGSEASPSSLLYVHHLINRDFTKAPQLPVAKCGLGQVSRPSTVGKISSEFLAQGDDSQTGESILFTSKDGTFKSGYFMGPETAILNQVDIVNLNEKSVKVFVNYEIEYVDGHDGKDAAGTLMSVTGCTNIEQQNSENAIKLDKNGEAITESPKFLVSRDARIVSALGHMHAGGKSMTLLINGKTVCNSNAVYAKNGGNQEMIQYMSGCPEAIPIKKGDFLQLKSTYDLKAHPIREGGDLNSMGGADVMGMFYVTFAVD